MVFVLAWVVGAAIGFAGGAHMWTRDLDLELSDAILLGFLCLMLGPLAPLAGLIWFLIGYFDHRPQHGPIVLFRRQS